MKDGRTHLAHKAEHAVDMETGAIVAVTLHGADVGDTTTIIETAIAATEQVEDAQANVDDRQSLEEIVGDKGYHSNQTLIDLDAVGSRSYVSAPDRGDVIGRRIPSPAPVYGNRRRMAGTTRPPPDAPTRRTDRTLVCASLRHGRDAAHPSARPHNILVLAPLAVDQAAARCSYDHESGGNPPAAVSTTATNTRRRTSRPVKMSLRANRLLTRRACMAGVLVSRPNRKARCGRTKL